LLSDSLFSPIEGLLNRGIAQSATAAALARELDSRSVAIRISGTGLRVRAVVSGGRVHLDTSDNETDGEISGGPVSLTGLLGPDSGQPVRDGRVEIHGDGEIIEQFQALLAAARPDLEEELSVLIGDVAAHQAGRIARELRGQAGRAGETLARSLGEFLTEERGVLPTRAEAEEFMAGVDELANDVERAAARLQRIRAQDEEAAGR